jgi:hypothetical protein
MSTSRVTTDFPLLALRLPGRFPITDETRVRINASYRPRSSSHSHSAQLETAIVNSGTSSTSVNGRTDSRDKDTGQHGGHFNRKPSPIPTRSTSHLAMLTLQLLPYGDTLACQMSRRAFLVAAPGHWSYCG